MSSKFKKIRRTPNRTRRGRGARAAKDSGPLSMLTFGSPDPCECPICAVMGEPEYDENGIAIGPVESEEEFEKLLGAFALANQRERERQDAFNREMDAYVETVVGDHHDYFDYLLNTPDDELTDTDRDVLWALAVVMTPGAGDDDAWVN